MSGPGEGQGEPRGEFAAFEPAAMGREKPLHEVPPPEPPGAALAEGVVPGPPADVPPSTPPGAAEPASGGYVPPLPSPPPPVGPSSGSYVPPLPPPPPPVASEPDRYPMRFDIEYPERLSRLSTFFRGFLIIPVWFFLYLLQTLMYAGMPAGWVTVFVKKRYPRWLFAANTGAMGFEARAWAYAALLTDRYPSFDVDTSPVTLEYDDPPQGELSRWRVLFWKGILLIPHFIVLSFLMVGVVVVVFLSWWAILFTGRYPRGMFGFVTGVTRWYFRVQGYFASFNDRFPPYALSAEAGPAANSTTIVNGAIGALAAGGIAALIAIGVAIAGDPRVEPVDYSQLARGVPQGGVTVGGFDGDTNVWLSRVTDPGDQLIPLLTPGRNERVVVFAWTIENESSSDVSIRAGDVRLRAESGGETKGYGPALVVVGGTAAPATVAGLDESTVQAVFIIPKNAEPVELRFTADFLTLGGIKYVFE